jgi:hypothetical protein
MTNETKDMTDRKKTMLTLPDDVVEAFRTLEDTETRDDYVALLRASGWTLQSIAAASELSRERVRQIVKDREGVVIQDFEGGPTPLPPEREIKAPVEYVEPLPETLERLLELKPLAMKVRSNLPDYREEAEEYTALLNHAHTVEGVTLYRLAKRLGVTHGALRFRLARYGYKQPKTGTSKVYTPIKRENRVDKVDSVG